MTNPSFCGGCAPFPPNDNCRNSFARSGVLKVHWECWASCNLSCAFCYRTRDIPLDTEAAKKLLLAVSTSGVSQIVFAGGDPSIRPDIVELIDYAHSINCQIEVQTNAHHIRPDFLKSLEKVNLVGLSIDGPDARTHDSFRGKPGNFDRVMDLLRALNEKSIPIVVRTIVAKPNFSTVPRIAALLQGLPLVMRWSLLEFSPVGDGAINWKHYTLERSCFDMIVDEVAQVFTGPASLDIYRAEAKAGTYALVTPGGYLYGTSKSLTNDFFPIVGSMIRDHLAILAEEIPFSKGKHTRRYEGLM